MMSFNWNQFPGTFLLPEKGQAIPSKVLDTLPISSGHGLDFEGADTCLTQQKTYQGSEVSHN